MLIRNNNKKNDNEEETNLIVLTNSLPVDIDFDDERLENITIITGFEKQMIEDIFKCENYIEKQNIKCCIIFNNNTTNNEIEKIKKEFEKLPEFQSNYNYLSKLKNKKPYKIEKKQGNFDDKHIAKLSIAQSKKTIGLYDFGISPVLLDILKSYWNIIVLPYNNTAKRTDFLKIDGVIMSNSLTNTKFVKENIQNEISKLINSDIPMLGLGFGGILMCEICNSLSVETKNENILNCFSTFNNDKKKFCVSNCYSKKIENQSSNNQIDTLFVDENNNCFGLKYKNNLMFDFEFFENNIDTARILNLFENLMDKNSRKYQWN